MLVAAALANDLGRSDRRFRRSAGAARLVGLRVVEVHQGRGALAG